MQVMQLFTIGLWQLHPNGTRKTGGDGEPIPTYNNDNIMAFARVWTGFFQQASRGGYEIRGGPGHQNLIDPVYLKSSVRDVFPKVDLDNRFLGDHYPLCGDLPRAAFLRPGAKYRQLGNALPTEQTDPTSWQGMGNSTPRLVLSPASSALYSLLCAAESGGVCTFPLEVAVTSILPCDGQECQVDTARVVELAQGGQTVYYEHVRQPCVELTFYENTTIGYNGEWKSQCLDRGRGSVSAGAACCADSMSTTAVPMCEYLAERVTYQTAHDRCAAAGMVLCTVELRYNFGRREPTAQGADGCGFSEYSHWTAPTLTDGTESCKLQVQIDASDGWVNVVHLPPGSPWRITTSLRINSLNYFSVHWRGGVFPTPENGCSTGNGTSPCELTNHEIATGCVCDSSNGGVVVKTSAVFTDASSVPAASELLDELSIGSVPPVSFDPGTYTLCDTVACTAAAPLVKVYLHASSGGAFDEMTLFEVERNGAPHHLRNVESMVHVGERFAFRNPPHFLSFSEPEPRDAAYEVEALLDHLVYHPTTAPHISYRLIQRLVTSNPSPRYMEVVSAAFSSGSYNGVTYSGAHGDLAATVAAMLLDREARSLTLELDPTFGQMREPLLKVLHLMRSLEYSSVDGRTVEFYDMARIGQAIFESPTVREHTVA